SGGTVAGVPANANPAEVINMSLGGDAPCSDTPAYQAAIDTAIANGSVVVAAAGNSNIDVAGATPASCNGVISVAASNKSGARSYYSSWGASIDITAPGGAQSFEGDPNGILSTVANNGYGYMQGTSMASPHVAGAAAVVWSARPSATAQQVRNALLTTAKDIDVAGRDNNTGWGLVQIKAAVEELKRAP
ncbi:S8 family serine peptidase, partial [Lysobacter sp. 2RAB21]